MRAGEIIYRHLAPLAFRDQLFARIQSRKVVQHAGNARFLRVAAVALREQFGSARDPDDVGVAVVLSEKGANVARESCVCQLKFMPKESAVRPDARDTDRL
jgi:hypothetical protein